MNLQVIARHLQLCLVVALGVMFAACAKAPTTRHYEWPATNAPAPVAASDSDTTRSLPTFRGDTGAPISWSDALAAASKVDVILLGEEHDNAVGHSWQLVFLKEVLEAEPRTSLSLEFLEREKQPLVDKYLAGSLPRDEFTSNSVSSEKQSKGWNKWYQPLIDATKAKGSRVVAANPPRRLVKVAREKGYPALATVAVADRPLFNFPVTEPSSHEYKQFHNQMVQAFKAHGGGSVDKATVAGFLRAQELWNGTMAESILREYERGAPRIFHVVGGFHVDEYGGIVRELHRRNPNVKVLTILLLSDPSEQVKGRADIVVRTSK